MTLEGSIMRRITNTKLRQVWLAILAAVILAGTLPGLLPAAAVPNTAFNAENEAVWCKARVESADKTIVQAKF